MVVDNGNDTRKTGSAEMTEQLRFRMCCGRDHCDAANHALDHGMSDDRYAEMYGCESKDIARQVEACAPVIAALEGKIASEREAREKCEAALRQKDVAMGVLFERLHLAGVDCSDLIP